MEAKRAADAAQEAAVSLAVQHAEEVAAAAQKEALAELEAAKQQVWSCFCVLKRRVLHPWADILCASPGDRCCGRKSAAAGNAYANHRG